MTQSLGVTVTGMITHCPACGAERKLRAVPLEYAQRAEAAEAAVSKLHEAVAFLRSCELSGEQGADHEVVLKALEAGRAVIRNLPEHRGAG